MFKIFKNRKGQNTAEYAVLIGLVIAVAVGMQTYVKRGIQGRMRDEVVDYTSTLSADPSWAGVTATTGVTLDSQYDPYYLSSKSTQDTQQDELTYTRTAIGEVTRDIKQKHQQKKGDFKQESYTLPSSEGE